MHRSVASSETEGRGIEGVGQKRVSLSRTSQGVWGSAVSSPKWGKYSGFAAF